MKKFMKKSNKEIVLAERIDADRKIILEESSGPVEIDATEGSWIVYKDDGTQKLFDAEAFNMYFQPFRELLLD